MADFSKDVVKELQNTNQKLGILVANAKKQVAGGAKAAEEKKDAAAQERKRTSLFEDMAKSLKGLHSSFLSSVKEKGKMGLGIIIAAIAAPIVALVNFFQQLAVEFAWFKKISGKGLSKLFAPLKFLFKQLKLAFGSDVEKIVKLVKDSKLGKGLSTIKNFFTGIGKFFNPKNYKLFNTVSDIVKGIGTKVKKVITILKNFFAPVGRFFSTIFRWGKTLVGLTAKASGILRFAAKFGTVLGKIFLPITILISAFDFITGFMKGYEEGGILGGLEGGLTKLFQGLIGMPLDLLKDAVAWILGKFGFENAKVWLNSFSFSELIGDMISGMFDMIDKAVEWVKKLFSDPVAALKVLWDTLIGGYASLMDIIWSPIKLGIAWIMRLFGWDEAAEATETFSIKTFILGVFGDVKDWIVGLFTWGVESGKTPGDDTSWSLKTMIFAAFGKVKDWIKGLFTWAATDEKVEGEEEGWSIRSAVTNAIKDIVKWIGSLFTFNEGAAGIAASIINIIYFLPNMVADGILAVTKWLLKLFGFGEAAEKVANPEDFSIGKMMVTAFLAVKDWIVGLFTWGVEAGKTPDGEEWSLTKMISGVFKAVKTWLFGIFGFGTDEDGKDKPIQIKEAEGFSLATMIGDVVRKVWDWFKGLFDIDFKNIAKSIVPDWAPGFIKRAMGIGGDDGVDDKALLEEAKQEKREAELAEIKKAADKREAQIGKVRAKIAEEEENIRRSKAGENVYIGREWKGREKSAEDIVENNQKLKELIAQNEKAKAQDVEFKKAALTENSIFTHDQGLYDRLDRIFPPANQLGPVMPSTGGVVMNAQRTTQMQQSGLQKSAASSAGPPIVNAPTTTTVVDNKQSNTTNTSVSYQHPSQVVQQVNVAV